MRALSTASRSIFGWVSAAVAVAVIAVSASVLAAPGKAYADTASHIEATGEIHVLVDGAGNASIPNVTLENTGSVAAYITGCTAPDELSGWTCDAVGKRIEPGQSVQASWSGQVSAETAAKLGSEAYFAGTLTYSYDDAELKGSVAIDNQDPCVGDTVTASASGLNVSDGQVTYQWYRVKDGVETAIDGAVHPAYTVVDADAGCTLLCKLFSSDSICIGSVSSDATHEVKRAVEAFAVYSAYDNSLNFYKRAGMPSAGEQFEGKTVTAVYTGIETNTYTWNLPWSRYASKIKTTTVVDDGLQPCATSHWFDDCFNLASADLTKLDTSNVTNMQWMFYGCTSLATISGLSSWNTSNVTDMNYMFSGCHSLTSIADLSNWDTSNVTNMDSIFEDCLKLTSIGDLSNWDTSKVTNMQSMFSGCLKLTSIGDLSGWNTSNVARMNHMFYDCSSLATISGLSSWNTSNVTNTNGMFYNCSSLATISGLSSWNTSNVTNTNSMFYFCSKLTTLDLSSWDTSKATNMSNMFEGCSKLTTLDLSSWDTSSVTNMDSIFDDCLKLTSIGDLSNWDTSKATNMSSMFSSCSKLASVGDLSGWNTSNVARMNHMFYDCESLTSVDLSNWDTSSVTNMRNMFSGCSKLSADCSNWNVSKVTYHENFNTNAPGVILPSAWQTSSDEDVEDSAVAPLCEDQENGDALSVSSGNNNEDANKTDGEASADSETEGNATTSADDMGAKEEEASDGIAQEDLVAA